MLETLLAGWWQFAILFILLIVGALLLIMFFIHFLEKAQKAGVDEISAGPVKVDFVDDEGR